MMITLARPCSGKDTEEDGDSDCELESNHPFQEIDVAKLAVMLGRETHLTSASGQPTMAFERDEEDSNQT